MIETLIKVMQPPINPSETGKMENWIDLEKRLGIKLPNDYKEYISTYGTGRIDDFLWVLNPFSKYSNANLIDDIEHFQWAYGELRKEFPEDYPRPPFPENDSLITWGETDNGDYLFWIYDKNQDPNEWKIGITDMGDGEYLFDMNMSTFLEKLVKNEIQTDAFPEDFLEKKNIKFQPINT